jgi:hypothetical protein
MLFNGNVFAMAATLGTLGINGEILGAAIPYCPKIRRPLD